MRPFRVLTFLLGSSLPVVSASYAQTSVPLETFMGSGRTVQASIGGRTGTFLLDTGGGVTNITPQFAAAIGCKPWGQISGFSMTAHRIDMQRCDHQTLTLGSATVPLETVGVFDGSGMMPSDVPHLDGTIALDAFAGRALLLGYNSKSLTLLTAAELQRIVRQRASMPLHIVRDAEGLALSVNLPVATSAGTAWFELDSGNVSPFVLVGDHLATLTNLKAGTHDTQQLHAQLADGSHVDGDTKVMNLTCDGNLGTSFLRHYDVVLDLAHAKVWLLPVSTPAKPAA